MGRTETSGFTLVELAIYSALIGMVLVGFVSFSLLSLSLWAKTSSVSELNAAARVIEANIANELQKAATVILPTAQASSTIVDYIDKNGGEKRLLVESGILRLYTDGQASDLNFDNQRFSGCEFFGLADPNVSEINGLKYSCSLRGKEAVGREFTVNRLLVGTIKIRN